ncbi:protein MEI2-like 4 isoform X10 [Tripterygium wilfordii]|uniref:Protein MEI2-like 4 isoform X10 n=1 Tax=Tripterygium wilfordii TaxID=458696 RepID=A0A7J7DJG3_TRIWF|nr:protein MEI2-like 4 isoform X2 [Tripterygium wilfordii]KAF5746374.1 protein MEI2-like 4 isoform X10 [Tripterygium wilfordii]
MPSETMELQGSSPSSFFSEDVLFPRERQVGFWKSGNMLNHVGGGTPVASSPYEKHVPLDCRTLKSKEHPEFLMQKQAVNHSLDRLAVGAERAASRSLHYLSPGDADAGTRSIMKMPKTSYFLEGDKNKMMNAQSENSLFSSSLSELFSRKMRLSSNNVSYGHSVDTVASHREGEDPFESLEEMEALTIGDLLPNDDDLFSGLIDRLHMVKCNAGEDPELDVFSSVGGMDLGDDEFMLQKDSDYPEGFSHGQLGLYNISVAGEHPYGELPSRTLFVRNINSNVEDSELRALFEQFGDIRTLYTACKHRGFVMISYYDIRAARNAMKALQSKPLKHRKLDIHYSIPKNNPSEEDINQGTLLIFNLDTSVSNDDLVQIFRAHGEVKEIREAPNRLHHKFVEFYDIRAAETALQALNKTDIAGKKIMLEPGHPAGSRRSLVQQFPSELESGNCGSYLQQNSSPNNSTTMLPAFVSAGNGNCTLPGHSFTWSSSYQPQTPGMIWPNSPSFVNGVQTPPQMHGLLRAPSHMLNTLPMNNHHVGSAPTVNPSIWDRQHAYAMESPEAPGFHPGSLGTMRISNNSLHPMEFVSPSVFPRIRGNFMDLPIPPKIIGVQPQHQRSPMFPSRGPMMPMMSSFDYPNDRVRSRRNEGSINQTDKKQYELDIDRILQGEDSRTTLMIKNIPNKYTSKMLLAAIDERHRGSYDFIYLPIDFKNKCNVGYAFINMTDPRLIVPFYQAFNGKRWEKFNSEKVATLAYGRIQGKAALVAHFQNSSLMNEDKRCRPILFDTDGPNAGDQVPFPMGVNVRARLGKARSTQDENTQECTPYLSNGEDSSGDNTI